MPRAFRCYKATCGTGYSDTSSMPESAAKWPHPTKEMRPPARPRANDGDRSGGKERRRQRGTPTRKRRAADKACHAPETFKAADGRGYFYARDSHDLTRPVGKSTQNPHRLPTRQHACFAN